jgi:single-strand DNA-binding protein
VATNRVFTTPDGERKEETEWFTIVTWGKLAEQCNQFLGRGRLIYAEGRMHTRTWEGQDGQRRHRTEIIARRVTFLDRQAAALPEERVEERVEGKVEEAGAGDLETEEFPF